MYFLIIATDKADCEHIRNRLRPERLRWLEANKHRLVAAGGMVDDRNKHVNGGVMIVTFPDRGAAERFASEDPFTPAGLYDDLRIVRWRKVFFDCKRVIDPDPFRAD